MRFRVILSLVSLWLAYALGMTAPASAKNLPETTKAFLQELKMNPPSCRTPSRAW